MMRRFKVSQRVSEWTVVYKQITDRFGANMADELFDRAGKIYTKYADKHSDCGSMKRVHVISAIACAALYLPIKELTGSDTCMPISELLLFHMMEIDRKHEHAEKLKQWQALQEKAMSTSEGNRLYSPAKSLRSAAAGKLDFCIGDGGKYRFAKLLCLSPKVTDAAVLLNSSEENTAIILKQLTAGYRSKISVPFAQLDLDYEHTAGKEDFELI